MISDEIKAISAATILNNMLMSSFFSICAINDAAKLLNRNCHCEEYKLLYSLHCMYYANMPRELREKIPELVGICLGIESVPNVFQPVKLPIMLSMEKPEEPKAKKWLSWLGMGA